MKSGVLPEIMILAVPKDLPTGKLLGIDSIAQ